MKVENSTTPAAISTPPLEVPVIKVDEIKSILYLGIKVEPHWAETGLNHAVDTYA